MFLLSADKSKLTVLQKEIITSGSVNVYDVQFQFNSDWDDMERVAVFRVGSETVSVVLDEKNQCKIPWECVRENDIGKTILAGVYGMIGTTVVLPTIWAGLGDIREGTRLGDSALPPTPSATEQLLAQVLAARDDAVAAAERAEAAAGGSSSGGNTEDEGTGDEGTGDEGDSGNEDTGTGDENVSDDNIATDEEVNDAFDDIFG